MRALDLVAGWPAGSAACVVCADAGDMPGAGGSRVRLAGTAGDTARRLPWASVTKLCTSLAVLVSVEEGTLSLDTPAGPPGATVAHLLAHASGLAPDAPDVVVPPGRRRIYSNAGFEVLAETLARHAGMPFGEYLVEAVFTPLGMRTAVFPPGASPASGVEGSLSDLAALAEGLLAPRIVSAPTMALATRVAFPGLAGVLPGFGFQDPCDWGLGLEVKGTKEPHWTGSRCSARTFGHFGRSGSFLWVDPVVAVSCAGLSERPFGAWAQRAWPALADAVLETLGARPSGTGTSTNTGTRNGTGTRAGTSTNTGTRNGTGFEGAPRDG